jgi:hypothetical protein
MNTKAAAKTMPPATPIPLSLKSRTEVPLFLTDRGSWGAGASAGADSRALECCGAKEGRSWGAEGKDDKRGVAIEESERWSCEEGVLVVAALAVAAGGVESWLDIRCGVQGGCL